MLASKLLATFDIFLCLFVFPLNLGVFITMLQLHNCRCDANSQWPTVSRNRSTMHSMVHLVAPRGTTVCSPCCCPGLWTVAVPTVTEGWRKPIQPTAQKAVGYVLDEMIPRRNDANDWPLSWRLTSVCPTCKLSTAATGK